MMIYISQIDLKPIKVVKQSGLALRYVRGIEPIKYKG